jgi:hypothetical protein
MRLTETNFLRFSTKNIFYELSIMKEKTETQFFLVLLLLPVLSLLWSEQTISDLQWSVAWTPLDNGPRSTDGLVPNYVTNVTTYYSATKLTRYDTVKQGGELYLANTSNSTDTIQSNSIETIRNTTSIGYRAANDAADPAANIAIGDDKADDSQEERLQYYLEALHVMEQYKSWHSVDSLRQSLSSSDEADLKNRRFAIGFYSCPQQLGNRMHQFMNSLLWAILTNRTLLVKYYDYETCKLFNGTPYHIEGFDDHTCSDFNDQERDCNALLQTSSWLPKFEEWAPILFESSSAFSLTQSPPLSSLLVEQNTESILPLLLKEHVKELHFWTTRPKMIPAFAVREHPWQDGYEQFAGVDSQCDYRLVGFPRMVGPILKWTLGKPRNRLYLLHTSFGRETARKLLPGVSQTLQASHESFVYGMLFRASFVMVEESLIQIQQQKKGGQITINDDPSIVSVGLHSRHAYDHGHRTERRCLQVVLDAVFAQYSRTNNDTVPSSCWIHLMSDRPSAVQELSHWIQTQESHHCHVQTVSHDDPPPDLITTTHPKQNVTGMRAEHGPWTGLGFLQDMAFVSRARHGFAAQKGHTSSLLVLELIQFDSVLEALNQNGPLPDALATCN